MCARRKKRYTVTLPSNAAGHAPQLVSFPEYMSANGLTELLRCQMYSKASAMLCAFSTPKENIYQLPDLCRRCRMPMRLTCTPIVRVRLALDAVAADCEDRGFAFQVV